MNGGHRTKRARAEGEQYFTPADWKEEGGVHALDRIWLLTGWCFSHNAKRGFACSGGRSGLGGGFSSTLLLFFPTQVTRTTKAVPVAGFNVTFNGLGQGESSPAGSACFDAARGKSFK